jgi:hypothetical protein
MNKQAASSPKTFSWHQDLALDVCRSRFPVCPFGCAKDGAANCDYNVRQGACEPGRQTVAEAALVQIRMAKEGKGFD